MTRPDIEQIRARLEALKTGWTSVAQWQQMALDFRRHIIEDESALLAAIDELTAQLRALQSWAEGARTDLAELTAQRDAVLALHTTDDKNLCDECYQDSPCETVRALT